LRGEGEPRLNQILRATAGFDLPIYF